jgi:membrane protease YdiL (CAAX protease family)
MSDSLRTRPLSLGKTIRYLTVPAVILYITHYYIVPGCVEHSGTPYFEGYLVGYTVTMAMFFVAALVAYRQEGHPFTWEAFKARYRLRKMSWVDWLWVAAIIILVLATYFGLGFTGEWVKSVPLLAPREAWPPEFGPGGTNNVIPGEFMEMPLKGQWWVVVIYFIGWLFNVLGEEFWFRGYILPRQELAFGKAGWVVNGLMFTLNHLWQPWILIAILPSSLLLAYVVQSRKNTWIGIIQHGIVNFGILLLLVGGAIGMPQP